MEKINYFMVLEKRLGDYNLIDINKLDICNGYVLNDIASIDKMKTIGKDVSSGAKLYTSKLT